MSYDEYVHPNHLPIFFAAARNFRCHILVRKTGRHTIHWIGRRGYTGKQMDLKAKTADKNAGGYKTAGLVCSPFLQPNAFSGIPDEEGKSRFNKAAEEWRKSACLITNPPDAAGFNDATQPVGCRTRYLLQTNRGHRHFGCVAYVDMGLVLPRYVHGDYDLYAIIPTGQHFYPSKAGVLADQKRLVNTMRPGWMPLAEREDKGVRNFVSEFSEPVSNFINVRIAQETPDFLGSLMVNHGEQINVGEKGVTYEPVLAILAAPVKNAPCMILERKEDHIAFYKSIPTLGR